MTLPTETLRRKSAMAGTATAALLRSAELGPAGEISTQDYGILGYPIRVAGILVMMEGSLVLMRGLAAARRVAFLCAHRAGAGRMKCGCQGNRS
jgi:hypothetical protein